MGKGVRERPKRLAEKLLLIREGLGLSQNGLIRRMGLVGELKQSDISYFETNAREPNLRTLLHYSRAAAGGNEGAGYYLEILIDDSLDLPKRLPNNKPLIKRKHQTVRQRKSKQLV